MMSEPPDYDQLAQQYLSLWQDQIASATSDPAVVDNLTRMMAGWQTMMGTLAQTPATAPMDKGGATDDDNESATKGSATGQTRPTSAAASSGSSDDVVRRLHERIADLEKRLAAVETKLSGD